MPSAPSGLHHVTAIATDPQRNVDFYLMLGLRLVKVTVNFDAPDTYHLYFGQCRLVKRPLGCRWLASGRTVVGGALSS
jgi:catechol 2,3-dioxygenase-like lactoylglutathione lyase family enzyme